MEETARWSPTDSNGWLSIDVAWSPILFRVDLQ